MSAAPTSFGKYFLTEKIATGGMAEIYLAKLLGPGGFEKHLIIKQIHPQYGDLPEFVQLFVREAKTLVSLSHGNIVPVYELGVLEGTYFIAMEYIDGPTLSELLRAAPERSVRIAPAMAAFICAEVVKGLDYAHRKGAGVIHRDLSPRNVMLSRDGEVKIVDFGIAATVDENLAHEDGDDGNPVGSFPYMSPEQVRREQLTPASDLFSVGILFWETLVGSRLFARDTPEDTLDAVLTADIVPPSTHNSAVPSELDEICLRALERDVAQRWSSAGELHAKLTRFLYSVEPPVTASALSALVARTCPPVPRQPRATSTEEATTTSDETTQAEGTRPMPGRERPGNKGSTRTFATHVQFKKVLERATPMVPFDAIPEIASETEAKPEAEAQAPAAEPSSKSRSLIGLTAVLLAGVAIVGILTITSGRTGTGGTPDAGAAIAPPPADAATTAFDAGVPDAAPPPDARRRRPPRADAAPRVLRGGKLTVKAKPWAKVFVDDVEVGDAPGTFDVFEGAHEVRLVYDTGETRIERTFTVSVKANGETKMPFVDFTVP
jgi:serine/threonine-protein kinase